MSRWNDLSMDDLIEQKAPVEAKLQPVADVLSKRIPHATAEGQSDRLGRTRPRT